MAKPALSKKLASNSISAAKSAIEIYNKPNFDYKLESFVILMINAWELLFKAYILKLNSNQLKSILIQGKQETKTGKKPKRFYAKRNRAGNEMTLEITSAMKKVPNLDKNLVSQIEVLIEVRDNAIHFVNEQSVIEGKMLEIATATTKSFVTCFREWFPEISFNESILPIGFQLAESISVLVSKNSSQEIKNLLGFIQDKETKSVVSAHAIAFTTEIQLKRSLHTGVSVGLQGKNPNAVPIKVVDTDLIDTKYNLDYDKLKQSIKKRSPQLKLDKKFHKVHDIVKGNKELSLQRLLDPRNPKSIKKQFYSQQAVDFIIDNY